MMTYDEHLAARREAAAASQKAFDQYCATCTQRDWDRFQAACALTRHHDNMMHMLKAHPELTAA